MVGGDLLSLELPTSFREHFDNMSTKDSESKMVGGDYFILSKSKNCGKPSIIRAAN